MSENNSNKIIRKLCREILPDDVFQKGNSRVYLDDNGYYFTMVEFQPYSLKKGTFLNVGVSFLFDKNDYLSFSYSYNNETRIGNTFIEYINDEQFEKEVKRYAELAKEYILKYREFRNIAFSKEYFINELDNNNWNPYIKAMFCFLADDSENGKKYYSIFLKDKFFEKIIEKYDYPKETDNINREYVLGLISNQRKFWHNKSSMKKMKTVSEFE